MTSLKAHTQRGQRGQVTKQALHGQTVAGIMCVGAVSGAVLGGGVLRLLTFKGWRLFQAASGVRGSEGAPQDIFCGHFATGESAVTAKIELAIIARIPDQHTPCRARACRVATNSELLATRNALCRELELLDPVAGLVFGVRDARPVVGVFHMKSCLEVLTRRIDLPHGQYTIYVLARRSCT